MYRDLTSHSTSVKPRLRSLGLEMSAIDPLEIEIRS